MLWPAKALTLALEDLPWVLSALWRALDSGQSEQSGQLTARERLKASKAWSWVMLGEVWDG